MNSSRWGKIKSSISDGRLLQELNEYIPFNSTTVYITDSKKDLTILSDEDMCKVNSILKQMLSRREVLNLDEHFKLGLAFKSIGMLTEAIKHLSFSNVSGSICHVLKSHLYEIKNWDDVDTMNSIIEIREGNHNVHDDCICEDLITGETEIAVKDYNRAVISLRQSTVPQEKLGSFCFAFHLSNCNFRNSSIPLSIDFENFKSENGFEYISKDLAWVNNATTPEIRWHFGPTGVNEAILSVDILPTSNRKSSKILASGGADKEVKIWKILATGVDVEFVYSLIAHDRSVNAVRFSSNGQYLASASDDATVILWSKPKSADEYWEWEKIKSDADITRKYLSCGHKGDVVDLSWSPDSLYICSASVDNRVVIWNVSTGVAEKSISDHQQYVQGVSWDPKCMYLATQGNDRTCRIYLTGNTATDIMLASNAKSKVKLEKKYTCLHILRDRLSDAKDPINKQPLNLASSAVQASAKLESKPHRYRMFKDDTFKSFYRRLCWTPDGAFLLVPSGIIRTKKSTENCVYAFSRNDLANPIVSLPTGTSDGTATVAIRCNPILYKLRSYGSEEGSKGDNIFELPYRIVFAVITLSDLLIYDTQQQYPLVIASGIHYAELADVSWSSDGRSVVVASIDGYCTMVLFNNAELGERYNEEEKVDALPTIVTKEKKVAKQSSKIEGIHVLQVRKKPRVQQ